jgi:hypothetical protein
MIMGDFLISAVVYINYCHNGYLFIIAGKGSSSFEENYSGGK